MGKCDIVKYKYVEMVMDTVMFIILCLISVTKSQINNNFHIKYLSNDENKTWLNLVNFIIGL